MWLFRTPWPEDLLAPCSSSRRETLELILLFSLRARQQATSIQCPGAAPAAGSLAARILLYTHKDKRGENALSVGRPYSLHGPGPLSSGRQLRPFFLTEVGEQIPGDCEQGLALKAQAGLLLEGERAAEDALGGAETGDRDLEMRYTGEGNFGAEEKETSAGSDGRGKVSRQPANRENRGRSWLLWGGPFQQSQP